MHRVHFGKGSEQWACEVLGAVGCFSSSQFHRNKLYHLRGANIAKRGKRLDFQFNSLYWNRTWSSMLCCFLHFRSLRIHIFCIVNYITSHCYRYAADRRMSVIVFGRAWTSQLESFGHSWNQSWGISSLSVH